MDGRMMSISSSYASSSSAPQTKYDVFLSFRGEDTRNNFTSHLYAALCRQQIETFMDNELNIGDEISPALMDAIEDCKIAVIVFSKGYASSRWCLEELVKILECKRMQEQIVIPVFYEVDPSSVRHQTGTFGDAFVHHEKRYEERLDKVQSWRSALAEAASLSGCDSRVTRPESVLIEKIVKDILKGLSNMSLNDNNDLVGVDSKIKKIESLCVGSAGICSVGIWGIGGIGKTTIASALFKKISYEFEGSCFIQNVREESERKGGLLGLREKLLSTILGNGKQNYGSPSIGSTFTQKRLGRKKVLIVIDDVTNWKQIEVLIGGLHWFSSGSLIIITTRDKQVLKNCGVAKIYEVHGLRYWEALQLFSRYAFEQHHLIDDYTILLDKVLYHAEGVPLALKVLRSSLLGKSKQEWKSLVNKLEKAPHMDIYEVLQISYDGLNDEEQNIFLDIACFFKGENKDIVVDILDASGFSTEIGISVLIDKSLITISDDNNIQMNGLLEEMGKEIVRQESSKDPGRRSRLWHHDDVYYGTEAIEGISLDVSKIREIHLNPGTLTKMHKLRIFRFHNRDSHYIDCNKVQPNFCELNNDMHYFQGLEYLFSELRYFHWYAYPLKSLPSNFLLENLVVLEMPCGNVQRLWNSVQNLDKLKHIDLSYCGNLIEIPDLSLAHNLENLILGYCESLESLPSCIHLESLRKLTLSGCLILKMCPEISCSVEELYLDGTAIEELPSSFEYLSRLVILNLEDCSRLESLPDSICKLKSLEDLNLTACSKLDRLPGDLGNLQALTKLTADGIAIREVPQSIVCLNKLEKLSFKRCKGEELVGLLLPPLSGLNSLKFLDLTDCCILELIDSICRLTSLKTLILCGNNFERLPTSMKDLCKLHTLDLTYCQRLQYLPELPQTLREVFAYSCTSLADVSSLSILFQEVNGAIRVNLVYCLELDQNALRDIIKDVGWIIQYTANEYRKNYDKEELSPLGANICFPGSEIPKWFTFQSSGSFITLELPPHWFNSKFAGFAMCVVVASGELHDHGWGLRVCCDCEFGNENRSAYYNLFGGVPDDDARYLGSDHVFMGYFLRKSNLIYFREHCYSDAISIQFYLESTDPDGPNESFDCCEVIKCGIRLLYAQDCGEPMEEYNGSLSAGGLNYLEFGVLNHEISWDVEKIYAEQRALPSSGTADSKNIQDKHSKPMTSGEIDDRNLVLPKLHDGLHFLKSGVPNLEHSSGNGKGYAKRRAMPLLSENIQDKCSNLMIHYEKDDNDGDESSVLLCFSCLTLLWQRIKC